jgi:hypothetical protein
MARKKEVTANDPMILSATEEQSDFREVVTIRNISAELVLVGERYLFPGQQCVIKRLNLRNIPKDKLLEV